MGLTGRRIAREKGEYSVYLRISKDAPGVQVHVSEALRRQGLTEVRLRQEMEPYLKNKDYDRGLREGLHFLAGFGKDHGQK